MNKNFLSTVQTNLAHGRPSVKILQVWTSHHVCLYLQKTGEDQLANLQALLCKLKLFHFLRCTECQHWNFQGTSDAPLWLRGLRTGAELHRNPALLLPQLPPLVNKQQVSGPRTDTTLAFKLLKVSISYKGVKT